MPIINCVLTCFDLTSAVVAAAGSAGQARPGVVKRTAWPTAARALRTRSSKKALSTRREAPSGQRGLERPPLGAAAEHVARGNFFTTFKAPRLKGKLPFCP